MSRSRATQGCFGLATISHQSKKCESCKQAKECKEEAIKTLKLYSPTIDVTDYMVNLGEYPTEIGKEVDRLYPSKVKKKPDTMKLLTTLSGRAKSQSDTLSKRGINLRYCLDRHINPFKIKGSGHMQPLFDELIRRDEFGREHLRTALANFNTQWSKSSVSSHVATALQLFSAHGLIEQDGPKYKVIRNEISTAS